MTKEKVKAMSIIYDLLDKVICKMNYQGRTQATPKYNNIVTGIKETYDDIAEFVYNQFEGILAAGSHKYENDVADYLLQYITDKFMECVNSYNIFYDNSILDNIIWFEIFIKYTKKGIDIDNYRINQYKICDSIDEFFDMKFNNVPPHDLLGKSKNEDDYIDLIPVRIKNEKKYLYLIGLEE